MDLGRLCGLFLTIDIGLYYDGRDENHKLRLFFGYIAFKLHATNGARLNRGVAILTTFYSDCTNGATTTSCWWFARGSGRLLFVGLGRLFFFFFRRVFRVLQRRGHSLVRVLKVVPYFGAALRPFLNVGVLREVVLLKDRTRRPMTKEANQGVHLVCATGERTITNLTIRNTTNFLVLVMRKATVLVGRSTILLRYTRAIAVGFLNGRTDYVAWKVSDVTSGRVMFVGLNARGTRTIDIRGDCTQIVGATNII